MSLIEQIKKDSIKARIAKDTVSANLLVTLLSDITKVGKDAKPPRETTEEEAISVIKKYVKANNETGQILLEQSVENGGVVHDQLHVVVAERKILEAFLPKQLSKEELEVIIKGFNTKNMGEIMKQLKTNYAGLYDGKLASEIAKGL